MRLIVLACFLIAPSARSAAQPLIKSVQSIDSIVINADYVYIAKIIEVSDVPIPGGSDSPRFSFEVEECLKLPVEEDWDPSIKKRGMFVESPITRYRDWMKRESRLLIVSQGVGVSSPTVIELSPNQNEIFDAKLELLREPEQILRAARNAIQRTPRNIKRMQTHRMMLPAEVYKGSRWERDLGLILEVPADGHLEARAKRWLQDSDPAIRYRGARALRYFRTNENVKLLNGLLEETSQESGVTMTGQSPSDYLRQEAKRTLLRWGQEETTRAKSNVNEKD